MEKNSGALVVASTLQILVMEGKWGIRRTARRSLGAGKFLASADKSFLHGQTLGYVVGTEQHGPHTLKGRKAFKVEAQTLSTRSAMSICQQAIP